MIGGSSKELQERSSMFKFSFGLGPDNLLEISFGDARKRRRKKSVIFDALEEKFNAWTFDDGTPYWFWSDDPPRDMEEDMDNRELFSV